MAAAALNVAPQLLSSWIGGRAHGKEWKADRKANGGLGDSWCVNLETGNWMHGAGDERGLDLISLYSTLNKVSPVAALKSVSGLVGFDADRPIPIQQIKAPRADSPVIPIPPDAPPLPSHKDLGSPIATYWYGRDFVIARFEKDGEKTIRPLTWRDNRWTWKAFPAPKPIYKRELLILNPDAPVLVVEGEKCVDMAQPLMKAYVVVTWAGGANAVTQSNWSDLQGRDVLLWPDADNDGRAAMATLAQTLVPIVRRVRIIDPQDQPEGWDIADAIHLGWGAKEIVSWASQRVSKPIETVKPTVNAAQTRIAAPIGSKAVRQPVVQTAAESVPPPSVTTESQWISWADLGLDANQGGMPYPTLSNASLILRMHPYFRGKIWLDTFRNKIFHCINQSAPTVWRDQNTREVVAYIQQSLRLPKFSCSVVWDGIEHAAYLNRKNSLHDYLNALQWDGITRLDTWLSDCAGVEMDEYTQAVSRKWPIAMVARAYAPACQMDTMLVLEGYMGKGKSSFLKVLGGEWYEAVSVPFGGSKFIEAIQGLWLIEIPDMTGFGRREHSQILATVTIRSDRYRAPYARTPEDHPRQCVFAATSEDDDYLQDTRGRRRFWPIKCNDIDLDVLVNQRDQIFAEAVAKYREGEDWYVMPESAEKEQSYRSNDDPWTRRVLEYCYAVVSDPERIRLKQRLVTTDILRDALDLPLKDQGQSEKIRIAKLLRANGWVQLRDCGTRYWKPVIRRQLP